MAGRRNLGGLRCGRRAAHPRRRPGVAVVRRGRDVSHAAGAAPEGLMGRGDPGPADREDGGRSGGFGGSSPRGCRRAARRAGVVQVIRRGRVEREVVAAAEAADLLVAARDGDRSRWDRTAWARRRALSWTTRPAPFCSCGLTKCPASARSRHLPRADVAITRLHHAASIPASRPRRGAGASLSRSGTSLLMSSRSISHLAVSSAGSNNTREDGSTSGLAGLEPATS